MSSKSARNRTRYRRCSLEQCEARQMLSVAPIQSPQATLVSQSLAVQLAPGMFASELNSGGHIGGALLSSAGGQFSFTLTNAYGNIVIPLGSLSGPHLDWTPPLLTPDVAGEQFDVDPWRIYQPPNIDPIPRAPIVQPPSSDPIPAPQPISAPAPISVTDPISPPGTWPGPDPISNPQRYAPPTTNAPAATVSAPVPVVGSIFPAAQATAAGPSPASMAPGAATDGIASQRWLSATFSPAEEQRLDAATVAGNDLSPAVTRDLQARFALEPTRVTFQAFCVGANVELPAFGADAEPLSTSKPAPQEVNSGAMGQSLQMQDSVRPEATSGAMSRAVHDAAILDWDSPHQASQHLSSRATGLGQAFGGHEDSASDRGS